MKYLGKFSSFDKINEEWFPNDTYLFRQGYIFEFYGNILAEITDKGRTVQGAVEFVELVINEPDKIKTNFKVSGILKKIGGFLIQLKKAGDEDYIQSKLKGYGTIKKDRFHATDCLVLTLNKPIEVEHTDEEKLSILIDIVGYNLHEGLFDIKKEDEPKVIKALEDLYKLLNMKDEDEDEYED
jgi:hypothetical protein